VYNLGIEAFLAVVRTQNISKAAEHLHLAQSTVSKRIRVLEQEIGAPLIERGKGIKSIHLTPAGEIFIDLAERWISLSREMSIVQASGPKLALSIGVVDSIVNSLFPPLFDNLIHHQFDYRLKIITGHSAEHYDLIETRQTDVAFSLLEQTHQNVRVEKCFCDPLVILRTKEYTQNPPRIYRPQDLDPRYELYVRWGPTNQLWHDAHWPPSANRIQLDTAQLVLQLLRDPDHWSIVPLSVAKSAVLHGNFSICHLADPPPERIVYKLTHKYPKSSTVESLKVFDQYLKNLLDNQ